MTDTTKKLKLNLEYQPASWWGQPVTVNKTAFSLADQSQLCKLTNHNKASYSI